MTRHAPLRRVSLAALLAAAPALGSAQEAQDAPVRAVTLFEAGLAELTRDTGDARDVTLSVPLRDVNDVLKSLLLRGAGVEGARITLDGATPVADAFASLPFPPEAATDLPALLRSVPGLRVRVTSRAYPEGDEGTLMGVAEDCAAETGCETVLTILHDDGAIRRHVFDEALDLSILDEAVTDALAQGLAALRAQAGGTMREIAVAIEGDVDGGALSYVVAAPAWKTSYRALTGADGAVDLQAWAVIENATGEDWEDVSLTLSSGSPRTLAADLHGRTWRYREVVAPSPTADAIGFDQAMMAEPAARAMDGFAAEMESFAAAPAPIVAQATASEGVLDSRFSLEDPVDLAVGQMISLPFLSAPLDATHLAVWQGSLSQRTGNPDLLLEIVNDADVRLPAGIMTVSDERGGYVGDAEVPLVAPGEMRAVPYGVERRVRVEENPAYATTRVSLRAAEGTLRIVSEESRETTYLVTAPGGEAREVAIDHPLYDGWTTEVVSGAQAGEERQDDDGRRWLRVTLDVSGGQGAKLSLRDVRPIEEVVVLGTLDEAALLAWAGEATDDATRAYLDEAAALAGAQARAGTALAEAEAEARALVAEQDRVRRLLGSVANPSEAYDRFLGDLLALEDRIAGATAATEAAREAAARAREAFAAHLAG